MNQFWNKCIKWERGVTLNFGQNHGNFEQPDVQSLRSNPGHCFGLNHGTADPFGKFDHASISF